MTVYVWARQCTADENNDSVANTIEHLDLLVVDISLFSLQYNKPVEVEGWARLSTQSLPRTVALMEHEWSRMRRSTQTIK